MILSVLQTNVNTIYVSNVILKTARATTILIALQDTAAMMEFVRLPVFQTNLKDASARQIFNAL